MTSVRALVGTMLAGSVLAAGGPLTAQRPEGAAQPAAPDNLLASETEYEGWKRYHTYCDRCHGQDAIGAPLAPDVRRSVAEGGLALEVFRVVVRDGRVAQGMPGFAALLSDEQIDQIYAYVKARAERRLAPGRPRRTSQP